MACCSNGQQTHAASQFPLTANKDPVDDADIEFEKRKSNLFSIFSKDPTYTEHRATLDDWSKQYEGVILTAVAQANLLKCHNWRLPFLLCLLTSISAFAACLQKLKEMAEFSEQHRLEKANYIALHKSLERLKEEGAAFDVQRGQPELAGPYTEKELRGKGTFDALYSSFVRFCSVWIISYAGAVLLVLFLFSGITLFSIHQILCNPGG